MRPCGRFICSECVTFVPAETALEGIDRAAGMAPLCPGCAVARSRRLRRVEGMAPLGLAAQFREDERARQVLAEAEDRYMAPSPRAYVAGESGREASILKEKRKARGAKGNPKAAAEAAALG
jgi:hypothetical protein